MAEITRACLGISEVYSGIWVARADYISYEEMTKRNIKLIVWAVVEIPPPEDIMVKYTLIYVKTL